MATVMLKHVCKKSHHHSESADFLAEADHYRNITQYAQYYTIYALMNVGAWCLKVNPKVSESLHALQSGQATTIIERFAHLLI